MKQVIYVLFLASNIFCAHEVVFINPVSDIYSCSSAVCDRGQNAMYSHRRKKGELVCSRLGQMLFNEVVMFVEQRGDRVRVQVPQFFYVHNGEKYNTFWTHKNNIISLATLPVAQRRAVPKPIDFNKPKSVNQRNVITLRAPWYNKATNTTYSVGTRFIHDITRDNKQSCGILFFDFKSNKLVSAQIPKNICCKKCFNQNDQRKEFISILRGLTSEDVPKRKGKIPYVWGGMSFVEPFKGQIKQCPYICLHKKYLCWYSDQKQCVNGFDCSGIVLRCAQMAGIPYFYRNTTTLAERLWPVRKDEKLLPGDLIWTPGHVMIIADVNKGTLIESTIFENAYNCVREVPLNKKFDGIASYKQLLQYYNNRTPVRAVDRNLHVYSGNIPVKLFRLC